MPNLNSQMHPKHPQIQFPQSLLGPTPSNLDSPIFRVARDPGRTRDGVRQFADGCLKFL